MSTAYHSGCPHPQSAHNVWPPLAPCSENCRRCQVEAYRELVALVAGLGRSVRGPEGVVVVGSTSLVTTGQEVRYVKGD